jgi:NAD(P)-dependent dehydrogenase (short-subunit alcohol dehydrogenase family)
MSLDGRSIVVTGASRGFGRALALRFVCDGAHVTLAARDADVLRTTADEVRQQRISPRQQILEVAADVGRPADVERLVATALDGVGRIDVLVCNAGVYGPIGPIEDVPWADWAAAVETNLFGTVLCCQAVVPLMRRQGSGKIVVLSGGGATQPLPYLSAYAASKAAVVRFVETLAVELSGSGIQINAIAPGSLNTRLLDQVLDAGPERVGSDFYARAVRQKEEGGAPLEAGVDLVAFLASNESGPVTGRLLSALWDDWRELPHQADRLSTSDVYTLRRIVPADRGWEST